MKPAMLACLLCVMISAPAWAASHHQPAETESDDQGASTSDDSGPFGFLHSLSSAAQDLHDTIENATSSAQQGGTDDAQSGDATDTSTADNGSATSDTNSDSDNNTTTRQHRHFMHHDAAADEEVSADAADADTNSSASDTPAHHDRRHLHDETSREATADERRREEHLHHRAGEEEKARADTEENHPHKPHPHASGSQQAHNTPSFMDNLKQRLNTTTHTQPANANNKQNHAARKNTVLAQQNKKIVPQKQAKNTSQNKKPNQ